MNRFKKELKRRGFKMECDYPWLPYDMGSASLQAIIVDAEHCAVIDVYDVIVERYEFGRDMKLLPYELATDDYDDCPKFC